MNIDPTRSGRARGLGPDRLNDPSVAPPAPQRRDRRAEPEPIPRDTDRVELSQAARELQRPALEPAEVSSLTAGQLQGILERLSQGFYDRPEVRDEVIDRMTADLERDPTEP
jgi:hypothetical protein